MNGLHTKLMIPGLSDIRQDPEMKNVSINKQGSSSLSIMIRIFYKPSTLPSQLFLRYITSSGRKYIVPDYIRVQHSMMDHRIPQRMCTILT
jgi:hypothetical protein